MYQGKPRVLIVDDDDDLRDVLEEFLSDDYKVISTNSAIEALSIFKKNTFDLVITDFRMPKMSGISLCLEIKEYIGGGYVPVIMLTGSDDERTELEGFQAGADDFLAKPFSTQVLKAKCRVMIKVKNLHDQLEEVNSNLETKVQKQVLELQKINQLRKYFSPNLIKKIIEDNTLKSFGSIPVRKIVTVLFCDLRNFTKMSDELDPGIVKTLLDDYLNLVTKSVFKWGGTINKFMGDGALAIFGDPDEDSRHCFNAINAAIDIKHNIGTLSEAVPKHSRQDFKVGFGVHTGPVVLGNVGSGVQVDYTAIGAAVNLAARLQAFSLDNNILVTKESVIDLLNEFTFTNERPEQFKGFQNKIQICEVERTVQL